MSRDDGNSFFKTHQNEATVVLGSCDRDAGAIAVGGQEEGVVFLELLSFDLDRARES